MRLLNTKTRRFHGKEIWDPSQIDYAILSHTWEDDEVTFQDMANGESAYKKKGWRKIAMTCEKAANHGFDYAWVDTCCIDKSSSAELTEAINSMFYWYQQATVCYVYLSDYGPDTFDEHTISQCKWWTRGWTLQELIAPKTLKFYNSSWSPVGTKDQRCASIAKITGIPVQVLTHEHHCSRYPVACRMSWAANRTTTRIEDVAYSLLGIFEINMPLLLQEEILRQQHDWTILAWDPVDPTPESECHGVLAPSPRFFADCGHFVARAIEGSVISAAKGPQVNMQLIQVRADWADVAVLAWYYFIEVGQAWHQGALTRACVPLRMFHGGESWARDMRCKVQFMTEDEVISSREKLSAKDTYYLATKADHIPLLLNPSINFSFGPGIYRIIFARDSRWDGNTQHFFRQLNEWGNLIAFEFTSQLDERSIQITAVLIWEGDAPPKVRLFETREFPAQSAILLSAERPSSETLLAHFPELQPFCDRLNIRYGVRTMRSLVATVTEATTSDKYVYARSWSVRLHVEGQSGEMMVGSSSRDWY